MSTASDTTTPPNATDQALTLADSPERRERERLRTAVEARKDEIAELDLELETLREELVSFEAVLDSKLWREHGLLQRATDVIRHLEGWAGILTREPRRNVKRRGLRHNARRAHAVRERQVEPEIGADLPSPPPTDERLKSAYRALARRFHPDLARDEAERLKLGALMVRINNLYRDGDLNRLLTLAEEPTATDDTEALERLHERVRWLESVVANLREERAAVEKSDTCALWRRQQESRGMLFDELKAELTERLVHLVCDVVIAIRELEVEVERYNRNRAIKTMSSTRRAQDTELQQYFDPHAHHRLVRLSLEALATHRASREAHAEADWLEAQTEAQPAILRLILLAYVAELSPLPLKGLESFADLKLRFESLAEADSPRLSVERALVEADDRVEYGVRQATERMAFTGLRLLSTTTSEALPIALSRLRVRRELKRVLAVLGEHQTCTSCHTVGFTVPVFHTRGLDNMRANLCPSCGHPAQRYWMPKGKDVQAVLNPAYLDLEIITEWTCRLHRATVATQLLPLEVERLTVKDLKQRLFADLFERYELGIKKPQVALCQGREALAEGTSLADLPRRELVIRIDRNAALSAAEAVEVLKHRIRNRFKASPS